MSVRNWFSKLFSKEVAAPLLKPPTETDTYVFFDGDQVHVPVFESLYKPLKNVYYFWVQANKSSTPVAVKKMRAIPDNKLKIVHPPSYGKESVDTFIAMKVVHVVSVYQPKRVYIVSKDLDFIDVILNAAKMYREVKFTLLVRRDATTSRRFIEAKLPENCSIQFYARKMT